MYFPEEDENKTYTVKELRDLQAARDAEKAKADEELKDKEKGLSERLALMEEQFRIFGASFTSGASKGIPKERAPGDVENEGASSEATPSKPQDGFHQESYTYPKTLSSNMPHINNSGAPPHFDETHFSYWKTAMESHLRSCSEELWEVVVNGYNLVNPNNLTGREFYDRQLNATACDKIRSAVHRTLHDQVSNLQSAKELWERIVVIEEGTNLIQKAKYEAAKNEMNMLMINDGESLTMAYARLNALRVKIKGLGGDKYHDGFDVNDEFIKSKLVSMIVVDDKQLALNLQLLDARQNFSPDDIVSYFTAT